MTDTSFDKNPNEVREQSAIDVGRERAKDRREAQAKRGDLSSTKAGELTTNKYEDAVKDCIIRWFDEQSKKKSDYHRKDWYLHLRILPPAIIANYALKGCVDAVGADKTLTNTVVHLAESAHSLLLHQALKQTKDGEKILEKIAKRVATKEGAPRTRQQHAVYIASRSYAKEVDGTTIGGHDQDGNPLYVWPKELSNELKAAIGGFMMNVVLESTGLFEMEYIKKKPSEKWRGTLYLRFTKEAEEELASLNEFLDGLAPQFGPMYLTPYPWDRDSLGPYHDVSLARLVPIVKHMGPAQEKAVHEAIAAGQMDGPIEALNVLQETPLTANQFVVEAVKWAREKVVESGGTLKIKSFPNLMKVQELPNLKTAEWDKLTRDEQMTYGHEQLAARKTNREVDGNHLHIRRALKEAEESIEADCFYLPHQFDFRGRIYHTSEFGHHNTDYLRAMMMFANKTPVTEANISFLALQLANTFGNKIDKLSFEKRLAWAAANEDRMKYVARHYDDMETQWEKIDPVTNQTLFDKETGEIIHITPFEYWASADDPFQFLAACNEWANIAEHGEGYLCGLPIALDATQSGIQIYAAMGRNQQDGENVNLTDNDEPGDLYDVIRLKVIDLVEAQVEEYSARDEDDLDDDEFADLRHGQMWLQKNNQDELAYLTRGAMKRPVMTYGYSSRRFGIADQIRSDTMEPMAKDVRLGLMESHPFGTDNGFHAAFYMAGKIIEAIEEEVVSVKDGMKFVQDGVDICNRMDMHMHYTTPLGFPVIQNYRDRNKSNDRVEIPKWDGKKYVRGKLNLKPYNDDINKPKSKRACSPNFVHSLDATLLMMTVLKCAEHDVRDIMVVHDSFSTTIGDAEMLGWAVRKSFVELFEDYCPYTDFKAQTIQRVADRLTVPEQGDLDITEVMKSKYAFS